MTATSRLVDFKTFSILPSPATLETCQNCRGLLSKVGADNFIKFDNDIIKEVGAILNQGHKSELGDYFLF